MSNFLIVPKALTLINPAMLYNFTTPTTRESMYLDDTNLILSKYENVLSENISQNEPLISFLNFLATKQFDYKIIKNKQGLDFSVLDNYLTLLSNTIQNRNLVICDESNFCELFNTIQNLNIRIIEHDNLDNVLSSQQSTENFDFVKNKLYVLLCNIIEQKFTLPFENHYNTLITSALNCQLISNLFDQSLIGTSGTETTSGQGELDVYVRKSTGNPLTIIEAMKLGSFAENNKKIAEHLKKLIINYNPVGLKNNIFIVFYEQNNFNEAWEKYVKYIEDLDNKDAFSNYASTCKLNSFNSEQSIDNNIQNLKVGTSLHTYENNLFEITHFFVNVNVN